MYLLLIKFDIATTLIYGLFIHHTETNLLAKNLTIPSHQKIKKPQNIRTNQYVFWSKNKN